MKHIARSFLTADFGTISNANETSLLCLISMYLEQASSEANLSISVQRFIGWLFLEKLTA